MEHGLTEILQAYLGRFNTELGGVLLGRRAGGRIEVAAAVFPAQQASSGISCSFDIRVIDVVHQAIESTQDAQFRSNIDLVVGWVHSHPRLGVFLSQQDLRTLSSWTDLDPAAVAMVVDPYNDRQQLGVWGRRGVRRGLVIEADEVSALSLHTGLALVGKLRVWASASGVLLWDVVCSDGVLSVLPWTGSPHDIREES